MKKNSLYLYILLIPFLTGCIEDKGNYNYISANEVMPITIQGLDTALQIVQGDTLHLSPQLKGIKDTNSYNYEW